MKKLLIQTRSVYPALRFDLKMKLTTLLLISALFTMNANSTYSQKNKATINLENTTIERFIDEIEKSTEFRFVYKIKDVDLKRKFSISATNEPIKTILKRVFDKGKTTFSILEKQIYLTKVKTFATNNSSIKTVREFQLSISGSVVDKDGSPLPGANIIEKGTTNGTQTDFDGKFSLEVVDGNAILVVSYVGFLAQEVNVNNQNNLSIILEEDASKLDEVVLVGYGKQKKSDLTGAVASLKGEGLDKLQTGNATQALLGRMAGVRIESNGGSPGGGASIVIRGVSTFTNTEPLYVIDGMFSDNMDFINPSDIKSIEVLKDASAAAIYGSRAANGVVIIATNDGAGVEGVRVDLESSVSIQNLVKRKDWLTGVEFAEVSNQRAIVDNQALAPGFNELLDPNVNTIVEDIAFSPATMINHSASVYGTSKNVSYNVSANWLDQEGILLASDFNRKTFRANTTIKKNRLTIAEAFTVTNTFNRLNSIWNLNANIIPTVPFLNPDNEGGYGAATSDIYPEAGSNHLARALMWDRHNNRDNMLGSLAVSYELADGLTAKINTGLQYSNGLDYFFVPAFYLSDLGSEAGSRNIAELQETRTKAITSLIEGTLNYKKTFNNHTVDLLAGASRQRTKIEFLGATLQDFPDNNIRVPGAASTTISTSGGITVSKLQSLFGRVNYNFGSKYFLTGTIRRDGSSRFLPERRNGVFPSASAAWRISEEAFLKESKTISNLKLRASYGELGSQNISDYAIYANLNLNTDAVFGTGQNRVSGVSQSIFANENLQWETTKTYNFGLDLGLLNGKISLTADYFNKKTDDILASLTVPPTSGINTRIPQNSASIENKGLEFTGLYKGAIGDFKFSINGNISFIQSEVLALGLNVEPIPGLSTGGVSPTLTDVGHPVASYYGWQVLGIFQTQAEIDALGGNGAPGLAPNAQPGDFHFEDLNGDGVLNNQDRTFLGNYTPDFEYGLAISGAYKNLDIDLIFNGVSGNEIYNTQRYKEIFEFNSNLSRDILNAWTPTNTNTNIPRIGGQADNGRASSFLVEDGSYFRLRNVQIGYTFPKTLTEKIKIRKLRLYGAAQNLFTITNYSGYYPEIGRNIDNPYAPPSENQNSLFLAGVDQSSYPAARTFTFGLQVGF